jgi:hypothetical protein
MSVSLLLGELSNPFNILRQVFHAQGRKEDSVKQGKVFIVTFLLLRLVSGPLITRWFCLNDDLHIILKFNSALMVWVGYIWAWRIINLAAKQLAEGNPESESFQRFYSRVKSWRKYTVMWNVSSFFFSFFWFGCSLYKDYKHLL